MGRLAAAPADVAELHRQFASPPDDARVMVRWWWFGPAVNRPELEREMRQMKEGGFGGFEVQPVYPLALDDPATGFQNHPYLSGEFLDLLRSTAETAHELGLRMDVTLGSGWPFGGPSVPVTEAAGRLRYRRAEVPAGERSVALPYVENGERILAAFLAPAGTADFSKAARIELTGSSGGRLALPDAAGAPRSVLFFIAGRTGQMVKRAAAGAEGFVVDHYDLGAVENYLHAVADPLGAALASHPPYAVFSDSLEVYASDWTADFPDEFRKRRGYDLTPYLPALAGDMGGKTAAVRHDWGRTLTELAEEHYLTPLREWAHRHGTRFRSQTYGIPPVALSSNALVDLPEGEGHQWREFSTTRWAFSAGHLYGKPVISSETWTWLHSPAFRATPLDMKAEADIHFLQGINQLVGHGWPYSPPEAGEPGWRFYAAAVFNAHNPWWLVMPDITRYLQRISFLLRQGRPANDVAIYLPTDDAWAHFALGRVSVNQLMGQLLGPDVVPAVLDAGYGFDFIDDAAIRSGGIPYRILVLPGVERIPLETYRKLEAFARGGGLLVATRRTPSIAPGLQEAGTQGPAIRALSRELFEAPGAKGTFVAEEGARLGQVLKAFLKPDCSFSEGAKELGFVHRKLESGEIYFMANTGNQPLRTHATLRASGLNLEWWDPFTGERSPAAETARSRDSVTVALDLAPYESRVLVLSAAPRLAERRPAPAGGGLALDWSAGWKVTFPGLSNSIEMPDLRSWTRTAGTRYFSGVAVYEKSVEVPESMFGKGLRLYLTLGRGTPVPRVQRARNGMRAWLESPVREAAEVYVNDARAGAVWHPPYELEVDRQLHRGANRIRILVGNLAINCLAGQSLPDYRLLNLRYGERFTPQDMENLAPLPSGLLGPVRLVAR